MQKGKSRDYEGVLKFNTILSTKNGGGRENYDRNAKTSGNIVSQVPLSLHSIFPTLSLRKTSGVPRTIIGNKSALKYDMNANI